LYNKVLFVEDITSCIQTFDKDNKQQAILAKCLGEVFQKLNDQLRSTNRLRFKFNKLLGASNKIIQ
jgi:hypothetical protein